MMMHPHLLRYLETLPEWQNEAQRKSLFSAIKGHQEDVSIQAKPKVNFWKSVLFYATEHDLLDNHSILTFDSSSLQNIFSADGIHPLCFPYVLSALMVSADISPIDSFLTSNRLSLSAHAIEYIKLAFKMPYLMTSKLYSYIADEEEQISITSTQGNFPHCVFVIPSIINRICKHVVSQLSKSNIDFIDHCVPIEDFKNIIQQSCYELSLGIPSEADISLLVKSIVKSNMPNYFMEEVDKFSSFLFTAADKYSLQRNDLKITVRSVTHLKHSMKNLQIKSTLIQDKISDLNTQIKLLLKSPTSRNRARDLLKLRMLYEKECEQMQTSQINIETILTNIKKAKTNEEILHAYQTGTSTLKTIVAGKAELTSATMDSLLEVLDEAKFIEQAINIGNEAVEMASLDVCEADLETELSLLVKDSLFPLPVSTTIAQVPLKKDKDEVNEILNMLDSLSVTSDSINDTQQDSLPKLLPAE
jgi:Snf7